MTDLKTLDNEIDIETVYKLTSKMRCIDSLSKDSSKEELLNTEQKLNSMFGQWFEGD